MNNYKGHKFLCPPASFGHVQAALARDPHFVGGEKENQFETITNTTAALIQNPQVNDNTAEIEFITENGEYLSGNLYDTAIIKVTMGRLTPTKKFLNEIADTLAADMIDYVKTGGLTGKITANLVYNDNSKNNEVN